MLYSVIFKGLKDDDIQTIGKRFNPPVLAKIGACLDARETREAISSLAAINNEALFIDLDAVDDAALIDALARVQGSAAGDPDHRLRPGQVSGGSRFGATRRSGHLRPGYTG